MCASWSADSTATSGAEVAHARFRRDLYFRVNGITLAIKPLRERRDALGGLATTLLREAAAVGRTAPRLDASALAALAQPCDWPGNVRELRTVMERALLVASGDEIRGGHILFDHLPAPPPAPAVPSAGAESKSQERLIAAATEHKGNVTLIARALHTSRTQVRRLAERYAIDLDSYR